MINNTLNDCTQKVILPVLEVTEELISQAINQIDSIDPEVEIVAMPDLGFSNNAIRMRGGFYTGMYLKWNSNTPFVPVDATINSCGVSIFLLNGSVSYEDFKEKIELARNNICKLGYNWNFERGNHFISLCRLDDGRHCVVLHASADEYKKSIPDCSLYPLPGVWYYNDIKVIQSASTNGRYLRYLLGKTAEKFISIATRLEDINHKRLNQVAEMILGDYIESEMIYVPHYGMPTETSVAIGCSWKREHSVLLTVPGRDLYIISNKAYGNNTIWLTPHGFGSEIFSPDVTYESNDYIINDTIVRNDDDVRKIKQKGIRCAELSNVDVELHAEKIVKKCNAEIVYRIHPLMTVSGNGFQNYN